MRAAAQRRVAVAEIKAAFGGQTGEPVDPIKVLMAEVSYAHALANWLRATLALVDPETLTRNMGKEPALQLLGFWSDRAVRASTLAVRAGIDARAVGAAELNAAALVGIVAAVIDSAEAGLSPKQRIAIRGLVANALLTRGAAPDDQQVAS